MFELNALPDDWKLTANGDTERSPGMAFFETVYLIDESGNYLTDESGNRLIATLQSTVYPQILSSLPDDWKLNAR